MWHDSLKTDTKAYRPSISWVRKDDGAETNQNACMSPIITSLTMVFLS